MGVVTRAPWMKWIIWTPFKLDSGLVLGQKQVWSSWSMICPLAWTLVMCSCWSCWTPQWFKLYLGSVGDWMRTNKKGLDKTEVFYVSNTGTDQQPVLRGGTHSARTSQQFGGTFWIHCCICMLKRQQQSGMPLPSFNWGAICNLI